MRTKSILYSNSHLCSFSALPHQILFLFSFSLSHTYACRVYEPAYVYRAQHTSLSTFACLVLLFSVFRLLYRHRRRRRRRRWSRRRSFFHSFSSFLFCCFCSSTKGILLFMSVSALRIIFTMLIFSLFTSHWFELLSLFMLANWNFAEIQMRCVYVCVSN